MEALVGGAYQFFLFTPRTTDVDLWLNVLPSLSDWGRVRLTFGSSIKWEIVNDFYWSINANANYDSRPPEDTEKTDWNFWTSLGYKF